MIEKRIYEFAFGLLIMLFIISKWNSLSLPYFWDEAWSYIPAISEMTKHHPGLLPGNIDVSLYRGHPTLFYFLASVWMKFVSGSLFSMHFFALLISLLAVVSFYRLMLLVLSPQWSFFGAIVFVLQEAFDVQSSFVLPEVFIVLLTTEAIRHYLTRKKIHFLILAGLLGLTKETGVVIIGTFILYELFSERGIKMSSKWVYLSLLPAVIFYTLQKIKMGWFFYPLHLDLIDITPGTLNAKAEIIFRFLFFDQGRKNNLTDIKHRMVVEHYIAKKKKILFTCPCHFIVILF